MLHVHRLSSGLVTAPRSEASKASAAFFYFRYIPGLGAIVIRGVASGTHPLIRGVISGTRLSQTHLTRWVSHTHQCAFSMRDFKKIAREFRAKTAMAVFSPIGLPIEFWSYKRLLREVLLDQDTTIAWCKRNGLLATRQTCPKSNHVMQQEAVNTTDGYRLVSMKYLLRSDVYTSHACKTFIVHGARTMT